MSFSVNKVRGFTLIELMISIVIGLIILSAVIGIFISMIKADNDNLKSIRLNQEHTYSHRVQNMLEHIGSQ